MHGIRCFYGKHFLIKLYIHILYDIYNLCISTVMGLGSLKHSNIPQTTPTYSLRVNGGLGINLQPNLPVYNVRYTNRGLE